MTQVPTIIRSLALGGWLMGPVTPRLALAGVTKLVFTPGPAGADYDVITPHPFDAHIRVGRSVLSPWFQYVSDLGAKALPVKTLAEALLPLENDLTGEDLTEAPNVPEFVPTHRHKGRGTQYQVIGAGTFQASDDLDEAPVTIYRGADGAVWVRPTDEFNDGRFEPADTTGKTTT